MGKRVMLALAAALLFGGAIAAVFFFDLRLPASAADRERAGALFDQAQSALETGDQNAALQALNESTRLDGQNHALRTRATLLVGRGDYDGALRDLDKLIRSGGGLSANYSLRCWLRARKGALDGARDDCDRALEIDPALASAYGNRGLVGLKQGYHGDAWNDFNTALRVGGSDEWVAWRLFGRGVAAWSQGRVPQGRQDIELALQSNPGVAAEFAQFGVGVEIVREFDDAAYAVATEPRSLARLRQYLAVYPQGAHAAQAQTHIDEIHAWIAEEEGAGRLMLPGFSLAQTRGSGPASDSYGAIAISRSTWRIAFATDYATGEEAERAAAGVCHNGSVRDCEAYAFRNVCAAVSISPRDRVRGLAWAHEQDDAVRTALAGCRERGGRSCVAVASQCTPSSQQAGAAASAASP
ncbi:MAG TPA: DUF4189 domain-containing protein [Vitreimonas sp.]|uniref:DUF4189 domain-containing protein n=1 Tax=Vitreimonas sp. TaxID=3069702 RepID=UPI002D2FE964|nr:DUF4189 domain-containing protein [Vitreimonas sp.]HYD86337.1 DUF4189 domain-containing protein [Vitreimonas sp.]